MDRRGHGAAVLKDAELHPARAWQPLTFGGVARYAHDWIGRLIITTLVVAALAASAVALACVWAWVPSVQRAIEHLPASAEIRGGVLDAPAAVTLDENPFVSIRLNPHDRPIPPAPSDLQVELRRREVAVRSMFGVAAIPYQPHWTIGLSRSEREPWWGAWKPAALAWVWFGTVAYLLASWIALALLYFIPARAAAFYRDRNISLFGAWKMCVAALMPGAVLLSIAILLYSAAQIRLLELLAAFVLHFVVGIIFAVGGVMSLPPVVHKVENPFEPEPPPEEGSPSKGKGDNPFLPE